jgi:hypothetical protein
VTATPISGDTAVEDLVRMVPRAPAVLRAWGLVCIQCGEPVWGTLAALAAARGIADLGPIIAALEQARELSTDA